MATHFANESISQDRIDAFMHRVRHQGETSISEISDTVAEAARKTSRYPTPEEQLAAVVEVTRAALAAIDHERQTALEQIARILEEGSIYGHQNATRIIDVDFHERAEPVQSRNHPRS